MSWKSISCETRGQEGYPREQRELSATPPKRYGFVEVLLPSLAEDVSFSGSDACSASSLEGSQCSSAFPIVDSTVFCGALSISVVGVLDGKVVRQHRGRTPS